MTSVRRTAGTAATATALVLVPLLALVGCGTERAGSGPGTDGSGTSGAPSAGNAGSAGADGPVDGSDASKYRENHAFQSTAELSPADRERGDAEVKKVVAGLSGIAEGRRSTEPRVRTALTGLGYPPGSISTGTFGTHRTTFILDLGRLCVVGSLDGEAGGVVKAEAHGKYLEGTGCVRPVGGH
ncbi:hypothetical protein ACFV1C_25330 [Streptomyces sp. NPDC059605]|uniref:hypothetical protein n=1 Tax=unclassified Streptomyces TaxID=2593676 RepID=UPI00367A3C7C